MALTKPPVLPAWAETGDKVQPTNAEIQAGWPLSNVPPARQRWNWILNFVANGIRYLTRRGLPDWANDETYEIGDCTRGPDGLSYKALTQNINKTPADNPTDWELWAFNASGLLGVVDGFLNKNVAGAVDVALTAAEARNGIINLSGAITANINVTVPATARRWTFINNTTGAFTLTVKTPLGTGYLLPKGVPAALLCDATNVGLQNKLGAGNLSKFDRLLTAATALTAEDVGSAILVGNTTNYTVTLPPLADVPTGATIYIQQTNTGLKTIAGAGANTLGCGTSSGLASINIQQGDSVLLAKHDTGGAPRWQIIGGSVVLRYSFGDFVSSLAASGYQKLPSGLIIQWGSAAIGSNTTVTFPIAFPTTCLQVVVTDGTSAAQGCGASALTATNFRADSIKHDGVYTVTTARYFAIGY